MKLDFPEEHIPLLIRALEHYDAYLKATSRHDQRLLEMAEMLKRQGPGTETREAEPLSLSARRRRHSFASSGSLYRAIL
jgi:hypothetical protein